MIVATRRENSDITANAYTGKGGNIRINTQGIFGITTSQQDTPFSNITASSTLGVQGQIDINQPDVDLSRSLINLPTIPVDTEVTQGCTAGGNVAKSRFTVTGRGGLPPNPGEPLNTDAVSVDLVTLNNANDRESTTRPSRPVTTKPIPEPIIEITGWETNNKGEILLTANPSSSLPHAPWSTPTFCTQKS
uniref:Filamentous haemagglutinin FhaB/tRNA nuclease CdiA-like TPS domain-containing protein n=1 Tax=Tolypothrix bouteillei VB521301 TaxID=1479485 RepID=A0A0C1REI6_9CYAN